MLALDGVDLELEEGESIGLVGPNGAGKTTFLRVLAGLEEPSAGEVRFLGRRVGSKTRLGGTITMIFQRPVMFNRTVFENVAYGLKVGGADAEEARERVKWALEKVELQGFEDRRASDLSGGEQQRVAIARALALKPRVLLVDEPTASLDPRSAAIVEKILAQLKDDDGTGVVLATHNIPQAGRLCDKIGLLIKGKIVRFGSEADLMEGADETLRDFAFFGNLFSGRSLRLGDGLSEIVLRDGTSLVASETKEGNVLIRLRPEDIIVSTREISTSARNVLPGRVVSIAQDGSSILLGVDAGVRMFARITPASLREMGLGPGSPVYLVFKASCVEVL